MIYAKNTWYVAAWASDLYESKPYAMRILGARVVLYRGANRQVVALEDRCVHRHAPLSLGRCEGDYLRCMYHGLLFEPGGKVVEVPGQDIIPPQAKVRAFPVVERHGWIWVWMGDPAIADEALIPTLFGPDGSEYLLGTGYLDYDAEARLINDNLLDFSHIAFVHEKSFSLGPQMAQVHADISPIDNGIRYLRWMEALAFNTKGEVDEPLDSYMHYDFVIPGILIMSIASFPLGTAKAYGFGRPDMSLAVRDVAFTGQAVTPMTEKTTRYFFSYGPHRDFGNEAMLEPMMALTHKAFAEDKTMIEAQQKVIDEDPDRPIMPTSHDRTVTMFSRMVERLVRAETGADLLARKSVSSVGELAQVAR